MPTDYTKIYGCSDDIIDAEGEYRGEYGCYGTDDDERGILVIVSDGTMFEIKYGKLGQGIWGITLFRKGELFDKITYCFDPNDDPYSDVVYLKKGVTGIYVSRDWEKMT